MSRSVTTLESNPVMISRHFVACLKGRLRSSVTEACTSALIKKLGVLQKASQDPSVSRSVNTVELNPVMISRNFAACLKGRLRSSV